MSTKVNINNPDGGCSLTIKDINVGDAFVSKSLPPVVRTLQPGGHIINFYPNGNIGHASKHSFSKTAKLRLVDLEIDVTVR